MKKCFVFLAAFMVLTSTALAQGNQQGLYLRAGVGLASGIDDVGTLGDLTDPPDEVSFDFGESPAFQLGLGYGITKWLSAEVTVQHNSGFDLEGPYTNDGTPLTSVEGFVELDTTSVMLTGLVDIPGIMDKNWVVRPYVGLGLGYAKNELGQFTFTPPFTENIGGDSEDGFAWKVILGATYPICSYFSLDLAYSYADYGEAKSSLLANDGAVTLNAPLTFDVTTHEVVLSGRFHF